MRWLNLINLRNLGRAYTSLLNKTLTFSVPNKVDTGIGRGLGTNTYTRSTLARVTDYSGAIVDVPINVPSFPYKRLSGSTWFDTLADGTPIPPPSEVYLASSSTATLGLNASAIVDGSTLFVCEYANNSIAAYSLANPAAPSFLSRLALAGGANPRGIKILNGTAFVANYGDSTIQLINVNNPSAMVSLNVYPAGQTGPKDLEIYGGFLYVCYNSLRLQRWAISGATINLTHDVGAGGPLLSVSVANNTVWTGGSDGVVRGWNIDTLAVVSTLPVDTNGSVCTYGNSLYYTDYTTSKLYVVDISTPTTPTKDVGRNISTNPSLGFVYGGKLYIPMMQTVGKLEVYDLLTPSNPRLTQILILNTGTAGFMAFYGGYSYVTGHAVPLTLDVVGTKLIGTGVLSEPAATNLALWSTNMANVVWDSGAGDTRTTGFTDAKGGTEGCRLLEVAATIGHRFQQSITVANATVYTCTTYLKGGLGRTWGYAQAGNAGSFHYVYINLDTGEQGSTVGTPTNIKITPAPNGYWKIVFSFTTTSTTAFVLPGAASANGTDNYLGDITKGIYCSLPQLEIGAVSTTYAPSTGTAGSRGATVDSYVTSGNLPASGIRHISIQWTPQAITGTQYLWSSGTATDHTAILHDGTNIILRKRVASANQDAIKALTPVAGTTYQIDGYIYADNTTAVGVNGTLGTPNANTTAIQTAATMELGSLNGASQSTGYFGSFKILGA